jgi:hypothetical protein
MPRISSSLSLLAVLLAAQAALAGSASAQQSAPAAPQSNQNQAPPALERVVPGSDVPATTIPSRQRTQISETRDGGQVTEVEVNSSGSHYYMKPNANNQPGNAQPGTVTGSQVSAPKWKIGEFDMSGKRKAASETGTNAPTTADAPPPPPMPADTGKK